MRSIQAPEYFGTPEWYDLQCLHLLREHNSALVKFQRRFIAQARRMFIPMYLYEIDEESVRIAHCRFAEAEISQRSWEIIGSVGKSIEIDNGTVIWDADEPLGSPMKWTIKWTPQE